MNRREALKSLAGGSTLGLSGAAVLATASCVPTEAPAAIADPTLEAINAHRVAWATWQSIDEADDPRWSAVDAAEREAWEAVCEIQPTTMAGLAAMSGYIGRFCLSDLPPDGIAIHKAFLTIATAAARFAYLEGRA